VSDFIKSNGVASAASRLLNNWNHSSSQRFETCRQSLDRRVHSKEYHDEEVLDRNQEKREKKNEASKTLYFDGLIITFVQGEPI
jgi:hypothetical protein